MYQATLTDNINHQPLANPSLARTVAITLGNGAYEAVDAEEGIWLIDLDEVNSRRLTLDGGLLVSIFNVTVEIEMP